MVLGDTFIIPFAERKFIKDKKEKPIKSMVMTFIKRLSTCMERRIMDLKKIQFVHVGEECDKEMINSVIQCIELPQCYLELIRKVNGFVEEKGIKIYGIEEIKERNETFEVEKYLPGYVAIGDDSGGNLLLMKACALSTSVFLSDCGSLFLDESNDKIINDFESWIDDGCNIDWVKEEKSAMNLCKVSLVGMPDGGSKELLKIKKIFNCNMSISELLVGAHNTPFIIMDSITIAKANVLMQKLGELAKYIQIN